MEQNLKSLAAENLLALWTQRFADCRSSGKSVKTWCEKNSISHKTYYYWQHKLFCMAKAECAPQFAAMLADFTGADKVYLACGYTDLRRGIDGLANIVQQQFTLDPFTNTLFLFCGRRRDRIKGLY